MAGNYPPDCFSDSSDEDEVHSRWMGRRFDDDDGSSCFGDGFLIDEWVDEAEEEGWSTCSSGDSENIVFTDGLPVTKIFVANFETECTPNDLKTLFSKFGKVVEVSILEGRTKPYAFVTYEMPEHACLALRAPKKELHLRWKQLRVFSAHSWHQPKESRGEKWQRDVSEVTGECLVNSLNDDCLLQIFNFLPIREQVKLERVCKRWQELSQSLWLRRSTFVMEELSDREGRFSVPAFRKALRYCGDHLTSLDFSDVTSDGLSAVLPLITRLCSNIEILKMKEVSINPCNLQNMGKKFKNLRELSLKSCQGMRDSDLANLLERCSKLEYLSLARNTGINGHFLKGLKPGTHTLILDECNNLSMHNLLFVMEKQNCGLKHLSLNSCQTLTPSDVQRLCSAGADKLQHLRLNQYYPRLNASSLANLGSLNELVSIHLKFNSSVKSEVIIELCKGCRKLEELDISGCEERDQPDARLSDRALEAVAKLPRLLSLNISYMMYKDTVLEAIADHARGLKLLECKGCPNISHVGAAKVLARCEKLEQFDLSGCYIQPAILKDAALAVGARKDKSKLGLHIGGTRVTKSDLDDLSEPQLQVSLVDRSQRHLHPDFNDEIYFDHYMLGDDDFDAYESEDSIDEEDLQVLINLLNV